jgi:hypothetical protein
MDQSTRGVTLRACWVLPFILAGSFGRPKGVLGVVLNTRVGFGTPPTLLPIVNVDVSRYILIFRYIYNFILETSNSDRRTYHFF